VRSNPREIPHFVQNDNLPILFYTPLELTGLTSFEPEEVKRKQAEQAAEKLKTLSF
jgi:hypothetical protein